METKKLITDYFGNLSPKTKRMARLVELVCYLMVIAMASGILTYWYADRQFQDERLEWRKDKQAEIERLQQAYGTKIDRAAQKLENAAAAVEGTATTLDSVANKVDETADKAAAASTQAAKAAATANRAATSAERVPQPTLQQINKGVEAANKQIRK